MRKLWNGKIDSFEEDDLKLWQVVKDRSQAQRKKVGFALLVMIQKMEF